MTDIIRTICISSVNNHDLPCIHYNYLYKQKCQKILPDPVVPPLGPLPDGDFALHRLTHQLRLQFPWRLPFYHHQNAQLSRRQQHPWQHPWQLLSDRLHVAGEDHLFQPKPLDLQDRTHWKLWHVPGMMPNQLPLWQGQRAHLSGRNSGMEWQQKSVQ
jgi:hypothetical protein